PAPIPPRVDVEVLRDVLRGSDPHRTRGTHEQRLLRIRGRDGSRLERGGREDAFGNVVEPREVPAPGDGHASLPEQHLERFFAVRPAPPRARALAALRELACGNWTALRDFTVDRLDKISLLPAD